ncbi:3-oxoacyl-[acyl-carrier-protein] synthase III C-terminal domain-containing protein [Nevskia sp.]|uniref:3-oxoacyl-ACP synthase III family protein n=1 Tax=Nevskia sp. TaxID=1929292 RepID=UPI0025FFB057|nr:3-oxoacyl-[acyl-carrier-protein] synthase III C-terminal domain-containing protein [Nevskia sp.]
MTARIAATRLRLLGSGASLPGEPIGSAALLARIAANFGIETRLGRALAQRLGVETRHHSRNWLTSLETPRPGDRNPELAAAAVGSALVQAGLDAGRLQYLIGHTTTPARLLPPNSAEVASLLGIAAPYAELRQACTGFANALQLAAGLLSGPTAAPIAIVGSEVGSVFCDPAVLADEPGQWVNLMQMGDGAGAVVIGPDDGTAGAAIENPFFGHIGLGREPGFALEDGGSDWPALRPGHRNAQFRHAHETVLREGLSLFRAGLAAAARAGVRLDDMRYLLPHQANGLVGDWLAKALDLPPERFVGNGAAVGNLGSASIWVALHALRSSGQLAAGDRVLVLGAEATQYLYGGFIYHHGAHGA